MNYYIKKEQQGDLCCGDEEEKKESRSNPESSRSLPMPSSPQSGSSRRLELAMLPDEILVNIGKSVAKLCGTRDFLLFSQTSQRTRRLLMHPETIADVLHEGNSRIYKDRSLLLLPSCSSTLARVHTLEQLALYESLKELGLLEENRFTPKLAPKVRQVLKRHPSATLVLDAHSGRGELMATTPFGHFDYRAKHAYEKIVASRNHNNTNTNHNTNTTSKVSSSDRIRIRVWGRAVAEKASESGHPYCLKAQKGKGWVEVFFKMDGAERNTILELPPRPDFYNLIIIPQEQRYENFVHFDDDSDED